MLNRLNDALDFQGQALQLRSERQRLIASNIANADTPGYVARDMDFAKTLQAATGALPAAAAIATSHAGHIGGGAAGFGGGTVASALLYATPAQTNLDRNTVDMDRERASFADNAIKYEATCASSTATCERRCRRSPPSKTGQYRSIRMSMLSIFNVSGSAASAQSQRLNVVASNLANADTVAGPNGQAYKARQVTFQTELMGQTANDPTAAGVRVSTISEDQTPGRRVHDPKHPSADAEGYVTYSNVNAVEEMVNMISASRSYQNNLEVMNTAKSLLLKTIQLGQS
jgi:flagellar basal-body rod protein FlgC